MELIDKLGLAQARLVALCGSGGKTTLMFSLAREYAARGDRVLVTTTTKMARDEAEGWTCVTATSATELLERVRNRHATLDSERSGVLLAYAHEAHDGHRVAGFAADVVDAIHRAGAFDRILVEADGSARKPLKAPARHEPVIPELTDHVLAVAGLNGLGLPLHGDNLFRPEIWSRLSGLPLGAAITPESLALCVAHPDGLTRGSPVEARRILFLNQANSPERRLDARRVLDALSEMPHCGLSLAAAGWLLPEPAVTDVVPLAA